MSDEHKLLQQAKEFDERALGIIFDTYYDQLYSYIYHHIGHTSAAEDLTADVFSRFLDALNRGKGPDRYLKAWLYRVAHNLVVDHLRKREHRDHGELDVRMKADGIGVSQQAQDILMQEKAREALQHLTDKQRDVIVLKFLEGMDNQEIARQLETTVGAIKALQHRGLNALRRHLVRTGAANEDDFND